MRFYALMVWRLTGRIPARLQLVYLADGRILTLDPVESDLLAMEEEILGIWGQIDEAARTEHFPPNRTPLCPWCSFQQFCPEFDGDILPLPPGGTARLLTAKAPRAADVSEPVGTRPTDPPGSTEL